jgi:hypothetical protein
MSTLDVVVLTPALPALALVATWWLPWDRWIPWRKLHRTGLGLYALHLSFVAYYFRLPMWMPILVLLTGPTILVVAVVEQRQ